MIGFVPSTIYELFHYFTLRYRLAAEELIVTTGLLSRKERHIPFARIQSLDLVQGVLHRLIGVAEVRVQTASGSEPEAVLRVLSMSAVEQLRGQIFTGREPPPPVPAEGGSHPAPEGAVGSVAVPSASPPLVRLSLWELVKLGLISGRGGAVVFLVMGIVWQFDLFERFDWFGRARSMAQSAVAGGLFLAMALAAAAALGLLLLSVVWIVIRLYDFTLQAVGDDLRISAGLFTRLSATVPRHRIQLLSVQDTLLYRALGRVSVRIETAGGKVEGDADKMISQRWFIPFLPKEQVGGILQRVLPGLDLEHLRWRPLGARAFRRMVRKGVIAAVIGSALFMVMLWPWGGLSAVVFFPLAVWHARASLRHTSYGLTENGIVFRSGVLTRNTSTTLFERIQVVSLRQSPFDRRHNMATLQVDTAGAGPAGHTIAIPYLEMGVARELLDDLSARIEGSDFRW